MCANMQNKRSFFLFIHVKHTSVSLFLGAYLDVPLVKITALQKETSRSPCSRDKSSRLDSMLR